METGLTPEVFSERASKAHLLEYWAAEYRSPYPETGAVPHVWEWEDMKTLLEQTTDIIGIDKAERRGLILTNPGLEKPYLTPTLFADIQLLSPGEKAPAHRHTSSASRLFMEGHGGYTVVEGVRCTMEPGDLVINPSWAWHDHGNEGTEDITYLNVLDIPLVESLGCIFYEHNYEEQGPNGTPFQDATAPASTERIFHRGGLYPRVLRGTGETKGVSPQLLYKGEHARESLEALRDFAPDPYDGYLVEYVNPGTGGPVQLTMSFNVQLLPEGFSTTAHRHTSSVVYWVVDGEGRLVVDAETSFDWKTNDAFVIPSWHAHKLVNDASADAVLLSVTDEPAVRALGLYRETAAE